MKKDTTETFTADNTVDYDYCCNLYKTVEEIVNRYDYSSFTNAEDFINVLRENYDINAEKYYYNKKRSDEMLVLDSTKLTREEYNEKRKRYIKAYADMCSELNNRREKIKKAVTEKFKEYLYKKYFNHHNKEVFNRLYNEALADGKVDGLGKVEYYFVKYLRMFKDSMDIINRKDK